MQQALVALSGNGILGLGEIENHCAIFNDYGILSGNEKVFNCAYQGSRVTAELFQLINYFVCDE